MTNKSTSHHRRSIRLKEYDYTKAGYYYVTICTYDHQCLFGEIKNGKMVLNHMGQIVKKEWNKTPDIRPNLSLDEFVIMPNHLHGILVVDYPMKNDDSVDHTSRGVKHYAPTTDVPRLKSQSQTTGAIVRGFKSTVTKQINISRKTPAQPVWQRNYYEHIIRNDKELFNIRKYITNNPLKWELDNENPINWES